MGPKWLYHRILHSLKLKFNYYNFIELKYANIDESLNTDKTLKNLLNFKQKSLISKEELQHLGVSDQNKIINRANSILNNKFEYYFNDEFYFKEINWHYNPYQKKTIIPAEKWYNIPTHSLENGDIKDYWELNRFVFVYDLINAFIITRDTKYSDKFINLTNDWIDNNPFEFGVNYKCSQETSFRCINWLMGILHLDILENNPEASKKILNSILKQSYHVISLMSYSVNCVRNNHTLNEALFLYIIGSYFSFPDNDKFYKSGMKFYNDAIEYQILKDGSYTQNSITYHRVMLLSGIMFKYFEKNKNDLSNEAVILLKKSIDFMISFIREDGNVPNYGSNDGSIPFNFIAHEYRDFRVIIDIAFKVFNGVQYYGQYKNQIDSWFLKFSKNDFKHINRERYSKESIYYRQGGYLILNKEDKTLYMRINDGKRRPGQSDNNSIDLWKGNNNIIIDTGSYKYTAEDNIIDYFRGSTGHNYLRINKQEPMKRISKFMYSNWSKSKIEQLDLEKNIVKIKNLDYTEIDIYRTIKLYNNLIIKDEFINEKNQNINIELFFQLNHKPNIISDGLSELVFENFDGNIIKFKSNKPIKYDLYYGSVNPYRGWKSTHYNKIEKSYQLVINLNCNVSTYIESEYIFKRG